MDLEDFKAVGVVFLTGALEHLSENPIGSVTAVLGCLYVYQKLRTQMLYRKKLEDEINEDKDGELSKNTG